MPAELSLVLSDFQTDLDRAEHLLSLIDAFREFGGATRPDLVADGTVEWPEATALAEIAPRVRTDLPILSGSILLYVCGRFEYFARQVVVGLADELAAAAATYNELPERVRKELRSKTLEIAQNPRRFGYSESESAALIVALAGNLGTAHSASGVVITSKVLTVTETNMNPGTLADLLKRVEITELWKELGKQAQLKAHLSQSNDRECQEDAMARLEDIMKARNDVAHPTGSNSFPSPESVREAVRYLRVLSRVLVDVVLVPR